MVFKPQSNRSGLHVNNVMLHSNHSLNRNLNRNLTAVAYIYNGDIMQTAAVRIAAVCLVADLKLCVNSVDSFLHF